MTRLYSNLWTKKGVHKCGTPVKDATMKELSQVHNREVLPLIEPSNLTTQEGERAMDGIIFLTEKGYSSIKAKTCANGSTQTQYIR